MTWVHPLSAEVQEAPEVIGGKAHGLIELLRLGLPVPPGFVVTTAACRAHLSTGRFPEGLEAELAAAVSGLEAATGRQLGGAERSLAVSVRSGAATSMPGMMNTILNFDGPIGQLKPAIEAIFSSWDTARARTYRELNGIPHDLGTAVVVQAMVFGNRDARSGSGIVFSHHPGTGENVPFGEFLFGVQGDEVVSGRSATLPLAELAGREPGVWEDLLRALERIEGLYRDACYVEFTFQSGELWLLQVRPGGLAGRAAVRVAVDLADRNVISRQEALLRVSPEQLRLVHTPRIDTSGAIEILTRGLGASPGVASGRVATTAEKAVRMAAEGPVVLVRRDTSPLDMHGLAAAAGVLTARGGPACHAAVVARSMGKPAVVGAAELEIDEQAGCVRIGRHTLADGALITIDGTGGEVVAGKAPAVTDAFDPYLLRLLTWADQVTGTSSVMTEADRLAAARAALRAAEAIEKPEGPGG